MKKIILTAGILLIGFVVTGCTAKQEAYVPTQTIYKLINR